jgi:hyperosmotically inducible periplasmic protein
MKNKLRMVAIATSLSAIGYAQQPPKRPVPPEAVARIAREVQRALVMVPQYGVFDYLAYQVNGYEVTLTGSVTQPVTKNNAEKGVKSIEGVEKLNNKITVLPLYTTDNQIRMAVFQAIYGTPALERYARQAIPSIHIIVNNGNVTLEGAVLNKGDADLAFIRAKTVPGTFNVTSNLKTDNPPPVTSVKPNAK